MDYKVKIAKDAIIERHEDIDGEDTVVAIVRSVQFDVLDDKGELAYTEVKEYGAHIDKEEILSHAKNLVNIYKQADVKESTPQPDPLEKPVIVSLKDTVIDKATAQVAEAAQVEVAVVKK